jgi:type IV secretory pathway protease TraF
MKITGRLPKAFLVSTILVFLAAVAIRLRGIVFNPSPSSPKGFYVRSADPSFVLFCPDQQLTNFTKNPDFRRNWVPSYGCSDGHRAFLKPIAAKPGDTVSVTSHGIAVNGKVIPHSLPLKQDNFGEPLYAYALRNLSRPTWPALGCLALQRPQLRQPLLRTHSNKLHPGGGAAVVSFRTLNETLHSA